MMISIQCHDPDVMAIFIDFMAVYASKLLIVWWEIWFSYKLNHNITVSMAVDELMKNGWNSTSDYMKWVFNEGVETVFFQTGQSTVLSRYSYFHLFE